MAVGRNDLRWRSFLHSGCSSLVLKELLKFSTVWCRGWEVLSMMDVSLANILLSATSSMESSGQPRTGQKTRSLELLLLSLRPRRLEG